MKKNVSRTPASFTAVIGKRVVNEAEEGLNSFLATAYSQITLPSYFPDLHSPSPSCNTFDQAFHLFPTASHLIMACAWRTRTGSLSTLSGQLQGGGMGCAASTPRACCCAKLPSDPEIINIWKLRVARTYFGDCYLFW